MQDIFILEMTREERRIVHAALSEYYRISANCDERAIDMGTRWDYSESKAVDKVWTKVSNLDPVNKESIDKKRGWIFEL
jgi:hypothetical protein